MVITPWKQTPPHWEIVRLKYVTAKIGSGKTPGGGASVYQDSGVIFLRSQNVHTRGLRLEDVAFIAPEVDRMMASTCVRGRDVLLNITGASLGRCAVVPDDVGPANVNQHVCIIRARRSRLQPEFLQLALCSRPLQDAIFSGENGVSREGLTFDAIGDFAIALPPIPEQIRVVSLLNDHCGLIDEIIAKKQRLIELLEEQKAALITRAVTRGLDPSVPMKDSGIAWLGPIPGHWCIMPLMYINQLRRPIMYGIVLPGPNVEEGVPIVKGGDVAPGRLTLDSLNKTTFEIEAEYSRSRLKGGDLVYAIRGSIGAVELVPVEIEGANLTQDAARIAPGKNIDRHWLLFALRSGVVFAQLESKALGATIRGINIRDLKRAQIPVPPPKEQTAIASYLNVETERMDRLWALLETQIALLSEYRSALITAAVTGQIDVSAAS